MTEVEPYSHVYAILQKRFSHVQILENSTKNGEERILLKRRNVIEAIKFLKTDPDTLLDTLVDISAIHHKDDRSCIYKNAKGSCFEIFYLLRSIRHKYRLRLSFIIPDVFPSIPTVVPIFPHANWLEREIWDLFGVFVEGHPDLRRLLLYPGFVGYPLHKSYPIYEKHPIVQTETL